MKPWRSGALRAGVLCGLALVLAACSSNNNKSGNNAPSNAANAPAATRAASAAATQASAATAAAPAASAAASTRAATAAGTAAAASGATKTVKLGAAFSLTGAAAQYGVTQKNGAQLAVEEINAAGTVPGVKLDLTVEDDASTKDQAITVFQNFITQDKVAAILGPTLSNSALASDPVAQQAKVPVLGVSNTGTGITEIGDFIFRDSLAEADVVPQTVAKSQQKLGFKTVAILYANDDAFSKAGYDAFKGALDKQGIKIIDTETFSTSDKDFSAQLAKVKDAKPDAIVVSALLDPAVGISTQARKLGMMQPIIGGNGFNSPAFIKGAGDAAEGVIVGAAWNSGSSNPLSQKFIAAYKAKYNSDPDQFAAQAYTGVYIMAQAMKIAGSTERQAIRDALPKVKDFDTVLGKFNFTEKRDALHDAVIQVVQGGKFVPLQ
ncbi:MAG TPA: ABC transporter substrate-binding protein [Dehalococcoidia bacterium]|nr:ABC transporter substrate-binding protein [Dehalococcoidia bacterium]